ncbi:AraC family transcriptional regulator [Geminocystis sp. NIES-3709]|uniref:helix-turn-helix transcriptional regulator n=1 Tax=Geminocystis sp. NIES-3709 TaxID=1617448 RepID=UPI0005FC4A52|nr:AraC family transcriptional regulator [Geminocystis sp. NIES-3709]BAQ64118.1 transcriptional regulator [Geminocystis sp. NIES-3709]
MTNYVPLLRVSALIPFVDFLEELGTPTEKLLRQYKLPIFALDEPNLLISRDQVFDFLKKASYQEGIENLGFLVGEKTPVESLGILGKLACQSLTLYDAIFKAIHLGHLFNSGEHFWLLEDKETAYFCQEYTNLRHFDSHHPSHFSLILMLDLIRKVAGKTWCPQQITLQTPFSNFTDNDLQEVLINKDVTITSIAFPRSFLALPFPKEFNLCEDQKHQEYEKLHQSIPSSQFTHSLTQAIKSHLKEGYPSINLASEIAKMPIRSLQRRLAKDGLTYSQLVTRIRYEKAVYLLQNSPLKMIEIAYELGYEDPAHFSRAFKRWTGISPHHFRCDQLNKNIG